MPQVGWRAFLMGLALLCPPMLAADGAARQQVPPAGPQLTIVAPAAPGGGWDQTARTLQQVLRATGLASGVQVENVPGAAGTIGLSRFVAERGRGDALLVTGMVMVSGIAANGSPVGLGDVTPIARLTGEYEVIVVPATSPYQTMADLVSAFRSSPAAVSWGGGSAGGTDDLLVRLLAEQVGVDPRRVNYIAFAGGGAALAALLGSKVSAGVSGWGEFAAQIANGGLRALAVSAPERLPGLDAPTLRESGIDLELANWRGLLAPPGLDTTERAALDSLVARLVATQEWRDVLARNGWSDLYLPEPAFAGFLRAEEERITRTLARVGRLEGRDSAGVWYPRFVLVVGGLVVLGLLRNALRQPARSEEGPAINRGAVGLLVVSVLANVALMPWLGFVGASTVLFVLAARALGSIRLTRDLVVGVVFAVIIYVGFGRGLGVTLPASPFGW